MGHSLQPFISGDDYNAVYNALSFVIASMGATTFYIFMHVSGGDCVSATSFLSAGSLF